MNDLSMWVQGTINVAYKLLETHTICLAVFFILILMYLVSYGGD